MKEKEPTFSLESIEFLLRHPWLIISSFVVIMSLTFAYLSSIPPQYETKAIISFEPAGGEVFGPAFIQKKDSILGSILLGENARLILSKVWPELNEKDNPLLYNRKLKDFRSRMRFQRPRKNRNLLHISFKCTDPAISYKAVKVTIDTIKKLSKRTMEEKIKTKLAFLEKELEFYKDKLKKIDAEIINVEHKLREKAPQMTPEEKQLVTQLVDGVSFEKGADPTLQKVIKYDEMLAELNLQLLEAKKQKKILEKQLESGRFTLQVLPAQDFENDPYIQEYNKAIALRKLAVAELTAKGYKPAHPSIKKLQKEIDDLETLKKMRLEELENSVDPEISEKAKREAEESLRNQLEDIEFQIDTLKDKIALMEKYKKESEEQLKKPESRTSTISDETSRLIELRNEREISLGYYTDLKKKLEEEKIKSRIEKEEAGFIVRIIEPPEKPLEPVPFQKVTSLFMGLLLALGASGGLAYIVDTLDDSVRSASELRELLGIPILASIDHIATPREIRLKQARKTALFIGLLVFVVSSKIVISLFMNLVGMK